MSRFRFSFLPVFFLCLGTAFAIAVFIKVYDYHADVTARAALTASAANDARAASTEARRQAADDALPPIDGVTSPETGTVIPIGETASPESIAAARAAREQRYRDLLAAGPQEGSPGHQHGSQGDLPMPEPENTNASTPPPQPQPKPPGMLDRLIRPIVNAVTGKKDASASSPPQQPVPATTTTATDTTSHEPKAKDLSSDTSPPQVMSIDFNPTTIHDGEQTILGVMAMDDLSGVRTISGSIVSPSGGLQGFALQREGDTNRYSSRILVPKDSPEGVWRVNYLNLTDNAGNPISLTYNGGGSAILANAKFNVLSTSPDQTGPTLKAVWLDKTAIKAGERDTIFVQADDDKSGVQLVSGVFQSPQKQARIGFGCRSTEGGVWQCEVSTPTCVDCGDWQLEQIQLQDKAGNPTTARFSDNPIVQRVRLNIGGDSCDSQPPALQAAILDTNTVSNVEVSTIKMTVTVSDDACGVNSISAQAVGPQTEGGQPPRIYFSFDMVPGDPNTWVGKITVPKLAAKGLWNVAWMQLLDKGNNLKTYSHADPVLANATFRVQ